MRTLYLFVALLALALPACQTSNGQVIQPKAKLLVEAPADHPKDVTCKFEVTLN